MKLYEKSALCPGWKRLRLVDHQKVEEAVKTWFKNVRAADVPVTGLVLPERPGNSQDKWEFTISRLAQVGCFGFEKDTEFYWK
jgi:hypothetical protein